MVWIFAGLTIGCIAFLIKILFDYTSASSVWYGNLKDAKYQKEQAEGKVGELIEGKDAAKARTLELEEEVKTSEKMKAELKGKIKEVKREHTKRGKVILQRTPNQSID